MTEQQAFEWCGHHAGTPEEITRCISLRTAAAPFARAIVRCIPPGRDQDDCLRKLKDALQASVGAVVAPWPAKETMQ